ncbi:hypothetical protein [Nocardia goodfellowii]|uniref:Lipoprotein LpqE n=1 Tax=Nocardia goodfellowii TaxID=882446 RepID=A0ABS4Q7X8_9NOCA|nr:hypothetical protein [Nocardia goodfellowii]MBP2187787.1 hypothetical protein [Nocardia goodfellowii]
MTALNAVNRRVAAVAALAASAALTLTGCSAGQISQTADQVAAVNGNSADVEKIALRNVHIVFPGNGYSNVKGEKALVALSIINMSESVTDELTSVDTDLGPVKITPPAGESTFVLKPQQNVVTATAPAGATATDSHAGDSHGESSTPTTPPKQQSDVPAASPALIEITGLTKDITPGLTYKLRFNFKNNGTVVVDVPVDAATAERKVTDKSGPAEAGHGGGGH